MRGSQLRTKRLVGASASQAAGGSDLCGSTCQVHVDVLVLSSGGNLLDSLALALGAVLSETLLPKVGADGLEEVRQFFLLL